MVEVNVRSGGFRGDGEFRFLIFMRVIGVKVWGLWELLVWLGGCG